MAAVAASSSPAAAASAGIIRHGSRSIVGNAAETTSQWDTKKHIAFSHVAHLGVDNVLFALVCVKKVEISFVVHCSGLLRKVLKEGTQQQQQQQ